MSKSREPRTLSFLKDDHLASCLQLLPMELVRLMHVSPPGHMVVAGGLLRSVVAGDSVRDVDVFVRSEEDAARASNVLYDDLKLSSDARPPRKSRRSYTLTTGSLPVQIIYRWPFETHADLVHQFDFTHCMAAMWWGGLGWSGVVDSHFYADVLSRSLVYTSPTREEEVGGAFLRMLDFVSRGYRAGPDTIGAVVARLIRSDPEREGEVAGVLAREIREVLGDIHHFHLGDELVQLVGVVACGGKPRLRDVSRVVSDFVCAAGDDTDDVDGVAAQLLERLRRADLTSGRGEHAWVDDPAGDEELG